MAFYGHSYSDCVTDDVVLPYRQTANRSLVTAYSLYLGWENLEDRIEASQVHDFTNTLGRGCQPQVAVVLLDPLECADQFAQARAADVIDPAEVNHQVIACSI